MSEAIVIDQHIGQVSLFSILNAAYVEERQRIRSVHIIVVVSVSAMSGINTKSENDDRRNGFLAWFVPCDRCLLFLATDVCNMSDDNSDV